jgi:tryptophan synthase beta chain
VEIIGAEALSCPTLTRGPFAYDFGDLAKMTPLLPMHTLGHDYVPAPIHAGGLRYHGMAPIVSHLLNLGLIGARSFHQLDTFDAGNQVGAFGRVRPAPETCHVLAAVVEEARRAKEEAGEKVILFNWSGHGLIDLTAYDAYLSGNLVPYELPDEEIQRVLQAVENMPKPRSF